MKTLYNTISIGLVIQILIFGFLSPVGFVSAEDGNLCAVDADVVLVLDVSGSMNDSIPSKCQWQQLDLVGPSYQCVDYNQDGLTESQCLAKPSPIQCGAPSYTAATPVKIDSAKNAAKSFTDRLMSSDQSALVTFSDTAQLVKPLSIDHASTKSAIDLVVTGGATNIGGAIETAIAELDSARSNPQATKTIILLTDGMANKPNGPGIGEFQADVDYAKAKATEAAGKGYKIFTIGLGDDGDINSAMLQDIADITGAAYHHSPDGTFLDDIYQDISLEICQYASISGCKYKDLNNNGVIDSTDTALSDWEVALSGTSSATQLTDQSGCYTFAGLAQGSYSVSESENNDKKPYTQTYPIGGSYNISLSKSENAVDKSFANYFPVCGNSIKDTVLEEQCDDGNTVSEDGCSSTCQSEQSGPVCGNETVETGEQCDDGNMVDGDGCSSTCQNEGGIKQGDVIITEIMQNPSGSDTYKEWFEIYNTTNSPIDLSGCVIRDNSSNTHTIVSLVAPANDYTVLARNGDLALNGGVTEDYVYLGFTLNNTSDQIILTCNSVEIDRVEYDGGLNFPNPDGASMVLGNVNLDNNVGSNWCTSTTPFGAGDKGTPGTANDSCGIVTFTITSSSGLNGSISPLGAIAVASGSNKAFTITPDNGYEISSLLVDSVSVAPTTTYTFNNVNSNHAISASFSATTPTDFLPPTANPPAGTYSSAQSVTLTAPGSSSIHYTTDGTDPTCSTGNVYSTAIPVSTNTTIKAIACYGDNSSSVATFAYVINTGGGGGDGGSTYHTITSTPGANGSITPSGSVSVISAGNQTFAIAPNSGYQIADVLIDGASVGAVTTYAFSNVTGNHTISASFSATGGGGSNNGGGGGTTPVTLNIFDEKTGDPAQSITMLTWRTNIPATTRAIYDTVSHPEVGTAPNYGYAFSTTENSTKVDYHVDLLTDLKPGTTYYWRAVSKDSSEVLGKELSFTTKEAPPEGVGVVDPFFRDTNKPTSTGVINEEPKIEGEEDLFVESIIGQDTLSSNPEVLAAALPFQKILDYIKNHWCYLGWLLLILLILYILYKKYKEYRDKKNKNGQS